MHFQDALVKENAVSCLLRPWVSGFGQPSREKVTLVGRNWKRLAKTSNALPSSAGPLRSLDPEGSLPGPHVSTVEDPESPCPKALEGRSLNSTLKP